jgi:hypothetical protein
MAEKEYIPLEAEEQHVLMSWAELEAQRHHPELHWLYHVPNGGMRSKATAGKLRAEGVKAGVPDVCLPVARGGYHGLYVELKRRKGGKLSDKQREWITFLEAQGYHACVCAGWEEARDCLLAYLDGAVQRNG